VERRDRKFSQVFAETRQSVAEVTTVFLSKTSVFLAIEGPINECVAQAGFLAGKESTIDEISRRFCRLFRSFSETNWEKGVKLWGEIE